MKIVEQGKRNVFSRHFHAKSDKDKIAGWRSDLDRILHGFCTAVAKSGFLDRACDKHTCDGL